MDVARFGVSCDGELLGRFDERIRQEGYGNRSEALADLMREHLLRNKLQGDAEVVGTVAIVYDHHQRELSERLLDLQHQHHTSVISTLHVHLNHHDCLEILVIRGPAVAVQELADRLISIRGVKHGRLMVPAVIEET